MRPAHAQRGAPALAALLAYAQPPAPGLWLPGFREPLGAPGGSGRGREPGGTRRAPGRAEIRARRKLERRRRRLGRRFARR